MSGLTTTFPGGRTSSWAGWLPAYPAARLRAAPTRSRNGPSLATFDMPMQTYSSGMSARVGFSVAVHMKPDILMIDEALSTRDAHFREKATAKMAELRESARAVFVVSHGLDSIKEMCNEVMWLDRGKLLMRGEPADVVDAYIKFVKVKKSASNLEDM